MRTRWRHYARKCENSNLFGWSVARRPQLSARALFINSSDRPVYVFNEFRNGRDCTGRHF